MEMERYDYGSITECLAASLCKIPGPDGALQIGQRRLLIVHGKWDRQVNGQAVVEAMKPRFMNLDVCMTDEGGSHAVHVENEAKVMVSIKTFANKLFDLVRDVQAFVYATY